MAKRPMITAVLLVLAGTGTASAQLLGGIGGPTGPIGGLGSTVDRTLGDLTGPVDRGRGPYGQRAAAPVVSLDRVMTPLNEAASGVSDLADLRKLRLSALIAANRATLDRDERGQPVRRGELIANDPDPASLAAVQRAGFRVIADERDPELGLRIVTLAVPRETDVRRAFRLARKAAPGMDLDYNHLFEPAGGALLPAAAATLAASAPARGGTRLAMIDGGLASHPSLEGSRIEQRGFAGAPRPTGHGTAVGSLLVGEQGPFRGAARGSQLFAADVYGGNPAAGSATVIVRALSWAASKRPSVINISLVGPPNRALARAVAALRARGITLVAAVGNDGPAAPPQYPASYPGVVAVTGVDGSNRALREAGRSNHLDFAAPGADLVAALPGKGFTRVRGTSFAAPFVAARLAATGSTARLAGEAVPGKGRVGRGVVCATCETPPRAVGLK